MGFAALSRDCTGNRVSFAMGFRVAPLWGLFKLCQDQGLLGGLLT